MSAQKAKKKRAAKKPESKMFVKLGAYLKRERELKGLTQNQVGKAMGMAGSRISAIESGSGHPGLANLGRWLDAIEIGPAAFGWRFERFCNDLPLEPIQSEAQVKQIVRSALGEVLHELADLVREKEKQKG